MKIADFFIALGFDIKGAPDVQKTEQSVVKLEFSSLKLLAAATALNAAFYAMMARAVETGVALQRFALTTGLSAEELQHWQAAAVKGNVAAATMATAIGAIQKARAAIAFGNAEAAAPWMLLGIDPRQDPFKVLEQLRLQVLRLDPAIARAKLGEMGFSEDILFLLKQPNFGRGALDRRLIVTPEEANRTAALGAAWRSLLFTLGQVGARFGSTLAEPLAAVLNQLARGLTVVGRFVDWLERGSAGAQAFLYVVLGLVTALSGLGVALGIIALGPVGLWVTAIGLLLVGLATVVLRVQDLWVALNGGKSAFSVSDNVLELAKAFIPLVRMLDLVGKAWDALVNRFTGKNLSGGLLDELRTLRDGLTWASSILGAASPGGAAALAGRVAGAAPAGRSVQQTNTIAVTIRGGDDPRTTGREVGRSASREISDAFGQMPLPDR